MEDETLEQLWRRESSEGDASTTLSREDLMDMVTVRARETRTSMQRRLRREIGYYLTILALFVSAFVRPLRPGMLLAAGALGIVLIGIVATLHRGSKRLGAPDLDGSAEAAIRRTLRVVDGTMRSYLIAYMLCLGLCVAMLLALVVLRHPGDPLWIVPTLVGGALALVWAYRSGRVYLEHHFGRYRDGLARCLAGLEGP